jgi:HlyD family secretion protein
VDAFKDRKFSGTVTEIANSSTTAGMMNQGNQQEATRFSVKIRVKEKEGFRPGMSCTAEIETRSRTNAIAVPFASVTTRLPKEKNKKGEKEKTNGTNSPAESTNSAAVATATNSASNGTNSAHADKKAKEGPKPIEVVFVVEGDHVKMVPVKTGISDDTYLEITDGLKEGQDVVSGGYRAISRDLEDGKKVKKGVVMADAGGDKPKNE